MKQWNKVVFPAVVLCAHAIATAQSFPEGLSTPSAADLKKSLDDKVFNVQIADGSSWRLDFRARGHYFVNTSTGFSGQGQWRAEDGKLCTALRGDTEACNDVRQQSETIHLRRGNGQIVQMVPK